MASKKKVAKKTVTKKKPKSHKPMLAQLHAEMSFGELVRSLRQAKGWTQAVLADKALLSNSRLSGIELGVGLPRAAYGLQILKAFRLPVEQRKRITEMYPAIFKGA